MATHTPAPWTLREIWPSGPGFAVIAEGKEYHVCGCGAYAPSHPGVSFTNEECLANGRLIAAAPDLLAALKALFADYKSLADSGDSGFWHLEDEPVGQQALAAIAKAEGAK